MLVYINDSKFWDLVNEADRVRKMPKIRFTSTSNGHSTDTYVHLLYNETESMRVNLSAMYSDDDDGMMIVFRLKSTGLVFGTTVLTGESAKDKALECLKKNSDRVFHDVTIWRKEHNR